MEEAWDAKRFGTFDGEAFFDYQATRPQIKLIDGVTRTVEWPENVLSAVAERPPPEVWFRAGALQISAGADSMAESET